MPDHSWLQLLFSLALGVVLLRMTGRLPALSERIVQLAARLHPTRPQEREAEWLALLDETPGTWRKLFLALSNVQAITTAQVTYQVQVNLRAKLDEQIKVLQLMLVILIGLLFLRTLIEQFKKNTLVTNFIDQDGVLIPNQTMTLAAFTEAGRPPGNVWRRVRRRELCKALTAPQKNEEVDND